MHAIKLSNPIAGFAVVYIGGVIGPARRARRRASRAGALLAALTLTFALAAFGCGSGGDSSTSTEVKGASPDSRGVADAGDVQSKQAQASSPKQAARSKAGGRRTAAGGPGTDSPAGSPAQGRKGQTRTPAQQAAIERQVAESCPTAADLRQCEALVKGAKQAKSSPSYAVSEPEDCVNAMSREECEATYREQKEAAESAGPGVNVQACLANPTPECEAVVRPIVERQRAAEEAGR